MILSYNIQAFQSLQYSGLAFMEKYVPKDEKPAAYVKKIRMFERSEFANFSKLPVFQVFWKIGLELLVTFVSMTKVTAERNTA